jgi:hypothetical protein
MRRLVPLLVAVAVLGVSACSGPGEPRALPPDRAGNSSDTLSPTETSPSLTSTPPPTDQTGSPPTDQTGSTAGSGTTIATASPAGSSATVTALDLPQCMIGTWTAPAARESAHLGLGRRSDGEVRGATGVLILAFTADHRWTFTYRQVKLDLTGGSVDVSGPMDGTWSLAGNTLTSTLGTASVTATAHLGGLTVPVPAAVNRLLRDLPPDQVFVTCTGSGLQFQLPTSQGGGTATFDPA